MQPMLVLRSVVIQIELPPEQVHLLDEERLKYLGTPVEWCVRGVVVAAVVEHLGHVADELVEISVVLRHDFR